MKMGRPMRYVSKRQKRDRNREKSKRYYHNHRDDILKKKREESTENVEGDFQFKTFLKDVFEGYKEAREYSDEYLYEDRMKWLRDQITMNSINPNSEYDEDTHSFSIGYMIAQIERYGGIVVETSKGVYPKKGTINES